MREEYFNEDEDSIVEWDQSPFVCAEGSCQEGIPFAEDMVMLMVCELKLTEQGLSYEPLSADDGDYLYEPVHFCLACWENTEEELRELVRDVPIVEDVYSILDCPICGSGIRQGEVVGLATHGNIIVPRHCPNGESGASTFCSLDNDPTPICIGCLNQLNTDITDLWDDRVTQSTECSEGTYQRCWRYDPNSLQCKEREQCPMR